MKVLFVCKASEKIGLGHLIRSRSLARCFTEKEGYKVDFHVIEQNFERLLPDQNINYTYFQNEDSHRVDQSYDVIFLDMLTIKETHLEKLKLKGKLVLLSPVFDRINDVDFFFHRTIYHPMKDLIPNVKKYLGLEYSIISDDCVKMSEARYQESLNTASLPIAISMGGGDANNKTLNILRILKRCKTPATFWVLLGEGYSHSYDTLVKEVTADTRHEIILVRTNRHMWHVLQNCALGIFPGGITVYEAAYAGLPSLILIEDDNQYYLVKELEEKGVCLSLRSSSVDYEKDVVEAVDSLFKDRKRLVSMHKSSACLDGNGKNRITECLSSLIGKSE